jgi:hypothetical protein
MPAKSGNGITTVTSLYNFRPTSAPVTATGRKAAKKNTAGAEKQVKTAKEAS